MSFPDSTPFKTNNVLVIEWLQYWGIIGSRNEEIDVVKHNSVMITSNRTCTNQIYKLVQLVQSITFKVFSLRCRRGVASHWCFSSYMINLCKNAFSTQYFLSKSAPCCDQIIRCLFISSFCDLLTVCCTVTCDSFLLVPRWGAGSETVFLCFWQMCLANIAIHPSILW